MRTKLTLSIREDVVNGAKYYAKKRHVSLSKIIENYLDSLSLPVKYEKKAGHIPLVIKQLCGSYKTNRKINKTKILTNALKKKYL